MTYRGHVSRAEIGLRAPNSRSTNIDASRGGVTGHYAGKAQGVSPILSGHTRCINLWRAYQNSHMGKGWVDIAYSLGVCQHGYILAGRGAGVRTAANGTNAGNAYWYAVCWIGGGSEKPTQDAIDAFWMAVFLLRRDGGAANRVNDHSDHKATACAGDPMRAVIDAGPTSPGGSDMHNPIDHDAHMQGNKPDWSPWKQYVEDGGTTVPESWKRIVFRTDLAWFSYNGPLADRVEALETQNAAQARQIKDLTSRLSALENALSGHTSNHPSGDGGGTVEGGPYAPADHGHEIKVVTQ